MDFFFGCWSSGRSNVDCRGVAEGMTGFFRQQNVPFGLFVSEPNFSAGIASFFTPVELLGQGVVETADVVAVGDVTMYDGASGGRGGAAKRTVADELLSIANSCSDESRLAALNGDFAAAIRDKRNGSLTLIRDHCGISPLHFSQHGEACAFSSLVRPLLLVPWASVELDQIGLASFLLMMAPGRERTYYSSVKTVLPAGRMLFGVGQGAVNGRFWRPGPAKGVKFSNADEAYQAVRQELVRATLQRTREGETVGVKLSGGLDSSTIAGIACTSFPERKIIALTAALPVGSDNPVSDERDFVDALGQRYPNLQITYETAAGADALEGADHWSTWIAGPVSDAYYYLETRLAQAAAAQGVNCLLTGDGGDYCVSARAGIYLTECLLKMRPLAFVAEFMRVRCAEQLGAVGVVRHKLLPNIVPRGVEAWAQRMRRGPWDRNYAISPALLRMPEFMQHFRACELHEISTTPVRNFLKSEQMNLAGLDTFSPSIDRTLLAPLGLRARYPLFDWKLMEICMAVPARFKIADGLDRALIRKSAGPFLPAMIAQRPRKGWFSPDFERRFANCAVRLEAGIERASQNEMFTTLVDVDKVRAALPLLRQPPTAEFDLGLLRQLLMSYRLGEFLNGGGR